MSAQGYGRAGRNLGAAIAVGVVLMALVAGSLFFQDGWLLSLVVAAASAIAVYELRTALATRQVQVASVLYLAAPGMVLISYFGGPDPLVVAFGFTVLVILLQRLRGGAEGYLRDIAASSFVAAYVPFMLSFAMLLLRDDNGAMKVLALVLLTAGTDTGGYISGVFFGRHPMAPSISPKKSWEGFAGSIVFNVAIGSVFFVYVFDSLWWYGALSGALLALVGTLGDLAESMIKRDVGIKDMSSLLPGHGGFMDRLDSVIPNAFAAWAIFSILLS